MKLLLSILLFAVMLVGCSKEEPLPGSTPIPTSATSAASPDAAASPASDSGETVPEEGHSDHDGHDH